MGYARVAEGRMWVRMERPWVPPAEQRARIAEREQIDEYDWDDFGWTGMDCAPCCDCLWGVCEDRGVEHVTPPLRRPLLAVEA